MKAKLMLVGTGSLLAAGIANYSIEWGPFDQRDADQARHTLVGLPVRPVAAMPV